MIGSSLLQVLKGIAVDQPPVWMMRQAGRYLPEYRKVRQQAGSFLDLCYTPKLAAEVTLQPIRRFGFDAAILFSDILVIADALGQKVEFVEGRGPVLEPVALEALTRLEPGRALERLSPVLDTVQLVRDALDVQTALIGFCGAPWTVATYMIAGSGTPDQAPARQAALRHPDLFQRLIALLVDVSAQYLVAQLRAGADVVMIFDSWAGVLDTTAFKRWAIEPARAIISRVRDEVPGALVLAFPKGAGARVGQYAAETQANGVGIDWTLPVKEARSLVGLRTALQGNLDPMRLVAGGSALDEGINEILEAAAGHPHIFNLGHGITPDTPLSHVEHMLARLREGRH